MRSLPKIAIAVNLVCILALSACTQQKNTTAAPGPPATAAGANDFVAGINQDLRTKLPYLNSAQWLQATYITDDSQLIGSKANEEFLGYTAQKLQQAKRFNDTKGLSADTARALMLLKNVAAPPPSSSQLQAELAQILSRMEGNYGAGKWCPTPEDQKNDACLNLTQIEKILNDPAQTPQARAAAWKGWHETARPIKKDYQRFVEIANVGAKEMGFADAGEVWRSGYDMPPAAFAQETERLWAQVKPLYEELHCYVRRELNHQYGEQIVPKGGLIPSHLLGNMWAQAWSNIYPLLEPYKGAGSLDVTAALKKQRDEIHAALVKRNPKAKSVTELAELSHKADAEMSVRMARIAENFYVSIGMPKLPQSFWQKSLLTRPRDREVVCHAFAWDMNMRGDVRVKQCIEPDEYSLITIHHELGHLYYDLMYNPLPPLFQRAAHDGFDEAIGDSITLSLTPAHLNKIDLVPAQHENPKATINSQMKLALDKIAFLPWGKLVDQWRWKVFSGEIGPHDYSTGWWKLREQYQGVAPPMARSEEDFDPGAKFHVPGNTSYTRYFLAFILQFQFQRALCAAAEFKGPLHECDIGNNAQAGKRFMQMLSAGASQPWQDTLEKLTGTRQMDGAALIEYFEPLLGYLKEKNAGQQCGW